MTFLPSEANRFPNFAIVVVFPEPFTPTTRITAGFWSIRMGGTGSSRWINSLRRQDCNSSVRVMPNWFTCFRKDWMTDRVVSIPISACMRMASISSQVSSLIWVAPNMEANRPNAALLDFARPSFHLLKKSAISLFFLGFSLRFSIITWAAGEPLWQAVHSQPGCQFLCANGWCRGCDVWLTHRKKPWHFLLSCQLPGMPGWG